MALKQIPNLAPAVFLSPTAQLEIVQDGTTMRTNAWNIAALNSLTLQNDVTTTSSWYPIFSSRTNTKLGPNPIVYTSDTHYNYVPNTGRLIAQRPTASQGIVFNSAVISEAYTFPTGENGMSAGPVTAMSVITVPAGSTWTIV